MRDIWRFGKERLLTGMEFVSSCRWRVEFQRQNSQEHQQREGEDLRLFHCRMQTRLDSYLRSKALALQKEGKNNPIGSKNKIGSTTVMGWGTPFPQHITEFIQIKDRIPQAQTRAMEQFFMFKFVLSTRAQNIFSSKNARVLLDLMKDPPYNVIQLLYKIN